MLSLVRSIPYSTHLFQWLTKLNFRYPTGIIIIIGLIFLTALLCFYISLFLGPGKSSSLSTPFPLNGDGNKLVRKTSRLRLSGIKITLNGLSPIIGATDDPKSHGKHGECDGDEEALDENERKNLASWIHQRSRDRFRPGTRSVSAPTPSSSLSPSAIEATTKHNTELNSRSSSKSNFKPLSYNYIPKPKQPSSFDRNSLVPHIIIKSPPQVFTSCRSKLRSVSAPSASSSSNDTSTCASAITPTPPAGPGSWPLPPPPTSRTHLHPRLYASITRAPDSPPCLPTIETGQSLYETEVQVPEKTAAKLNQGGGANLNLLQASKVRDSLDLEAQSGNGGRKRGGIVGSWF